MAEHAGLLLAALLIDAALGEPRWLWSRWPHPAVLMGRAVAALDRGLNTGGLRRAKGALATAVLGLGALALGGLVAALPLGPLWEVLAAAVLLAQKSLAEHVAAVAQGLRYGLAEGRRAVARIVGRDPATLDEAGVARAAIESAAENFSDGVAAPAFWFLLGGLPGVLLYKVTNTADSMIGYRTARHADFGWAAARFDDLLNWVPARLSAGLIALVFWPTPAGPRPPWPACWAWRFRGRAATTARCATIPSSTPPGGAPSARPRSTARWPCSGGPGRGWPPPRR